MKLNIRLKLLGGFFIVAALLIGVFGIGYSALNSVSQESNKVYQNSNENYLWQQWKAFQLRESAYYLAYLSNADTKYLDSAQEQVDKAQKVQTDLSKVVPPERKQQFDTTAAQAIQVSKFGKAAMTAFANKDMEAFQSNMTDWENNDSQIIAGIDAAIAGSKQATDNAMTASGNAKTNAVLLMIIISTAGILFAIGLGFFLSQNISKAINKVNHAIKKMANSDLTERISLNSSDEIGEMARSYNTLLDERIRVVKQLRASASQIMSAGDQLAKAAEQSGQSTQQVATSSQQMAKGAHDQSTNAQDTAKSVKQLTEVIAQLSKGANEQSAGVQKAVTSITQVSNTVAQVAENANQAAQGAKLAAESAHTGVEKTRQTLAGIEKISQASGDTAKKLGELGTRSSEIGKIVAVIDDIAAQTNLLALNAAIEAARAGEQGRGFAVVSDEVRKLAERSATATKEIAELIASIQKGVDEAITVMAGGSVAVAEGCDLAKQAGLALEQILSASSEVNSQVNQISAKTQEINAATQELVQVIDNVGSVTEENTAATEQMSANATQVSQAVETVAGISEENSAATEQVSASAQEMNAQIEEIVASSQSLKDLSVVLEQSMAKYKIPSENEPATNTGMRN
jgi:methyl-accepting chemotaxis protein